ncbi:glycine-N-acyltransferase-like protein 3 [Dermochelys coriacea]|uniref:glycine-N-acyltransferase-like protein 3 n=1 Tax=Dermochelys coriacea TaxID=27794 RepID=UPI001CA840DA|nr:glycine-N-acyltransferase-like protein 3 [Dermochelys coriacea]
MLILSCSSKLRLLEGTLRRHLPETLLVLSAVITKNHGNPAGYKVLVDSWPEFKAVLTRPHREQVASDVSDFYTNIYTAFYRDRGVYCALLGNAINWSQAFWIHWLQDGVYDASRDISEAKGFQLEASHYFTYLHPDPSSMPEIRSVSACATGPLASLALRCPRSGWLFPMQGLGHWGLVATSRIPVGLVGNSTSLKEPAGTGERSHGVDSAMGREIPLQLLHRAISHQPWQGLDTEQLCSPPSLHHISPRPGTFPAHSLFRPWLLT